MPNSIRSITDWVKHPVEQLRFTFDFSRALLPGRLIDSVDLIIIGGDDGNLTVTNLGANASALLDDAGHTIAINQAALIRIAGGTPGHVYTLRCQITDDNPTPSEADIIVCVVALRVEG
ncbi:MAG: hypothetical protein HC889_20500 [Synechococcaceae cyanobacterium SM1_2_3]|nr:hypothetical protein [Synechococcaceae cyanobacterium SM1_2_3]